MTLSLTACSRRMIMTDHETQFYGKTWIFRAQAIIFGLFAIFDRPLRVPWPDMRDVQVTGLPAMRVLSINGVFREIPDGFGGMSVCFTVRFRSDSHNDPIRPYFVRVKLDPSLVCKSGQVSDQNRIGPHETRKR